jgi:hypothetical protein
MTIYQLRKVSFVCVITKFMKFTCALSNTTFFSCIYLCNLCNQLYDIFTKIFILNNLIDKVQKKEVSEKE